MPTLATEAALELAALREADARMRARYRGEPTTPQPIHTVYVSADQFGAGTIERLHGQARVAFATYGATPASFAHTLGLPGFVPRPLPAAEATMAERFARDPSRLQREAPDVWIAHEVHARVKRRLAGHAVQDVRIDFEDGYGNRPDREEDADAARTAAVVADLAESGQLPARIGIRIEPLDGPNIDRAVRTLEIFVDALVERTGGALPSELVVTLPKITHAGQTRTAASLLRRLEARHGLPDGRLRIEPMAELTQALFDAEGRCPLLAIAEAAEGRCVGVHLGVYDFTASCQLVAAEQTPDHPLCDLARALMRLTLGGTGVALCDGATNILPIEPHEGDAAQLSETQRADNHAAIARAWRASLRHITHAMRAGVYQGWDMHAAQIPVRYAATYRFHLEGWAGAATRLSAILSDLGSAQVVGEALDDAATAQALLGQVLRAYDCGAIDDEELRRSGLRPGEVGLRSFARLLAHRRQRA